MRTMRIIIHLILSAALALTGLLVALALFSFLMDSSWLPVQCLFIEAC
jgi:hypothetical protein